ncbi:MAG: glycosyltransferase [Alphaproteobacteria bacterium]|nr:glycosyltransferase [Alphaproteobacteria bacterium]MDP6817236.1 glycosyltransferase [Alphaproteobacteria bacterium]
MPGRILVYTDSHGRCGVGINMAALLERLCGAGHEVFCAQRREEIAAQRRLAELGVQYIRFERDPDEDFTAFANDRSIPQEIFSRVRPDVVLFMNGHPLGTFAAVDTALARALPYVIWEGVVALHLLPDLVALKGALEAHYLGARAVITNCAENMHQLTSALGLSADFGRVILNGAADEFFLPRDEAARRALRAGLGVGDDEILCFTAATLEAAKGYQFQLGAAQILRDRPIGRKLKFAWAGEGSERQFLEAAIARFELSRHISVLGQRSDVAQLLDAADIFLLPSQSEGLPASILEAMAKGVPVIATAVGGIPEGLADCGRLLPGGEELAELSQGLAAALADLAGDSAERRRIGARGRARARAHFTRTRTLNELQAVIEDALAAR